MSQTGLKIAILFDTWEDEQEPAAPPVEDVAPPRRSKKRKTSKRERRPKLDREEIFDALGKLGHQPSYLEIDGHDASLLAVARCNADLIFNLTESYAGDDTKDMNLAAFLELLDKPYTGARSTSPRTSPWPRRSSTSTRSGRRSSPFPTRGGSTTRTTSSSRSSLSRYPRTAPSASTRRRWLGASRS
jgi:hypothetical protein